MPVALERWDTSWEHAQLAIGQQGRACRGSLSLQGTSSDEDRSCPAPHLKMPTANYEAKPLVAGNASSHDGADLAGPGGHGGRTGSRRWQQLCTCRGTQ